VTYRGKVTRTELHKLVDELPDAAVEPAGQLLRHATDPTVQTLLAAPLDDEPVSPQERAAADAAWDAHFRGDSVPVAALTRGSADRA